MRARRTYLLDGDDLLGLVVHGLVDGPEAAGAELLEQRVLAGGVAAWQGIRLSRADGGRRGRGARKNLWLGLGGNIVRAGPSEASAGRHFGSRRRRQRR